MVSSNIHVSAAQGRAHPEDEADERYHRTQLTWLLSIEQPQKHHVPFTTRHTADAIHYHAGHSDDKDGYHIHPFTTHDILGTILIKEGAHGDAAHIIQTLEAALKPTQPTHQEVDDDDSDRWLRKALHALQTQRVIETFDVGEFMTFAHGYFASRLDGEVPARIAYAGPHKDHHRGEKARHSFWLSYPTKGARGGDQESRVYGGLM
ncbi:hypothetical protein LTR53_011526 [Teratosphaeriaceae sp. CCFEE 6253]|nr:hypothetical protein LTR53_011526 [Teratosphaeriaceae sp. CCFEE 6253]